MPARAKHPKVACDVCGKQISVQYLTGHQRLQHGIQRRRSRAEMREIRSGISRDLLPQAVEIDKSALNQLRQEKLTTAGSLADPNLAPGRSMLTPELDRRTAMPPKPVALAPAPELRPSTNGAARKIRVLTEFEVVTDGHRIGIVEWLRDA